MRFPSGIPREDAVRAATYNPARQLGVLDEVGSIRDGKVADFVLCDAELNRQGCLPRRKRAEIIKNARGTPHPIGACKASALTNTFMQKR